MIADSPEPDPVEDLSIEGRPMPPDDPDGPQRYVDLGPVNEIIRGTFNVDRLAGELYAAHVADKVRGFYSTGVEIDPSLSAEDRAALQRVLDAHVP